MTRFIFAVVVISIFMSFFKLGSVTLFDVDEAVFSEATKEMVQSGNWITPTYNGENRYDKPILFYWLMAVSYKIFGINEFGARFPSALAGFILCIAIFFFLRELSDEKMAFYAVLSLTLSIYFFTYSHSAVTDMVLTLFITLSLFSFYLSIEKDRRYLYGLYIFSALSFLTKGLIGIIFPFGIAVIYLLIRDGLKGIKSVFNLKASVLFLIIALPWYIAQLTINGDEFIQQFFVKHHFKRYTGVISGHRGPIYYFIPALIIGMFPWIAFLPQGIREVFRRHKAEDRLKALGVKEFKVQSSRFKNSSALCLISPSAYSLLTFAFIWFAFIFVFFSFSITKLPNYILPAVPAMSILISSGMNYYQRERGPQKRQVKEKEKEKVNWGSSIARFFGVKVWSSLPAIMMGSISLLLAAGFLMLKRYVLRLGINSAEWIDVLALTMFIFTTASIFFILKKRVSYVFLTFLMFIFLSLLSIKALPVANDYLQETLYRYSLMAKKRLHDGGELITYGINNPSIVFYSGHRIKKIDRKDDVLQYLKSLSKHERLLVISKARDIDFFKGLNLNLLKTDGKYAIFERQ